MDHWWIRVAQLRVFAENASQRQIIGRQATQALQPVGEGDIAPCRISHTHSARVFIAVVHYDDVALVCENVHPLLKVSIDPHFLDKRFADLRKPAWFARWCQAMLTL